MGRKSMFIFYLVLAFLGGAGSAHASLAGWEMEPIAIEYNSFWLPSGHRETIDVEAPDTTNKFRIYFDRVWLEGMCDSIVIYDAQYTGEEKTEEERKSKEIQRIQGVHFDFLSNVIYGQRAKVVVETETCSWWDNFHFVDVSAPAIFHRGCVHNMPVETGMTTAGSCWGLGREVRRRAVEEIRERFSANYRPWGFFSSGGIVALESTRAKAPSAKAPDHSETNVQVAGVDEADIVKTDGNFIYALRGQEILIYKSWPAGETELAHRLPIQGHGSGLFLDGDRLIALSNVYLDEDERGEIGIMTRPESFTKVTVYDVSAKPFVVSEWLLAGYFHRARRIDGSVRLVLGDRLQMPEIDYYPRDVKWGTEEYEEALEILEEKAIDSVYNRRLSDWFSTSYQIVDGEARPISKRCGDFSFQDTGRGLELTSVITIDFDQDSPHPRTETIFARSDEIYQSHENMYIASNHNWSCREDSYDSGQYTYIHKFDTSRSDRVEYRASGVIEGALNDQFAMDEHQGFLRLAATNQIWGIEDPEDRMTNRVFVLEEQGNTLVKAGEIELHAPGERIMSSRFVEDKGYVVTFRRVDPLFTLDMSNPYEPKIMGELTVTGFSTYLHKLDDDHLFTIGEEIDPDNPGIRNVALSIFDVSDLSHPYLVHRYDIGTRYGRSEALWEHKAFTMYSREGEDFSFLAIPFTDYEMTHDVFSFWRNFKSTLKVFKVKGLTVEEIGEVDHSGLYQQNNERRWGWWYRPNVRRGVFVEDFVYAVSDAGIRVASLNDLGETAAEVAVPAAQPDTPPVPGLLEDEPVVEEDEPVAEEAEEVLSEE